MKDYLITSKTDCVILTAINIHAAIKIFQSMFDDEIMCIDDIAFVLKQNRPAKFYSPIGLS